MMFSAVCQPGLHRRRRHARHQRAVDFDVGQVADDVDVVMPGDRQIGLDQHAARPVERRTERLGQRRSCHTRSPEHRLRVNALAADP